jgi:hypothetical protein
LFFPIHTHTKKKKKITWNVHLSSRQINNFML